MFYDKTLPLYNTTCRFRNPFRMENRMLALPTSSDLDSPTLRRLRTLSVAMRRLITGGIAISAACFAWLWFGLPAPKLEAVVREITHASSAFPVSVSLAHRFGGFVSTGVSLSLLICALYQARQMFVAFARGEVLTADTAMRLRGMAVALTAFGLSIPLIRLLTGLVIVTAPSGPYWVLEFTLSDYFVTLLGGLMLAISWSMVEAARVAEENKGFI